MIFGGMDMPEMWVAVKSMILYKNKVLLVQRTNYAGCGEDDWEFPGGGLQFGEDLVEGLAREIKEEVGLEVGIHLRIDRLLYAMTAIVSPYRQIVGLTYLSYANSDGIRLSKEHKDFLWADRAQITKLLNRPMLNDLIKYSVLDVLDIV